MNLRILPARTQRAGEARTACPVTFGCTNHIRNQKSKEPKKGLPVTPLP